MELDEVKPALSAYHRALGGASAQQIMTAWHRPIERKRGRAKRLPGLRRKHMLSWQDEQGLYLPPKIAYYPEKELNESLYFWLAALSTQVMVVEHWLIDNLKASATLLQRYPGLRNPYQELVTATIDMAASQIHLSDRDRGTGLIELLSRPEYGPDRPFDINQPVAIPLWLYPAPRREVCAEVIDDLAQQDATSGKLIRLPNVRRQAFRVDDRRKTDGLLVFKMDSLFSRAEQVNVDRLQDDTMDDDCHSAAHDLDIISLSRQRRAGGSNVRFDLDLPSPQYDDLPVGDGIKLREWDYKKQRFRPAYCLLQPMVEDRAEPSALPSHLREPARHLIRQFSSLDLNKTSKNRQPQGEEIDLDHWLATTTDPEQSPDPDRYYKSRGARARNLACLLLADLSLSTDTPLDGDQRIIDVIRDALLLFAEALNRTRDRLAIYGFSSVRNKQVRYHVLKNFAEPHTDQTRGRIMAIRPGFYTRLGAAIRQSCDVLKLQSAEQRLLLIVSDGKPNDIDHYEGRYGIEDTRHAVVEAKQRGIVPFCITVDTDGNSYLPYLFGNNGYALVQDATRLPSLLPQLYIRLTSANRHFQ
ncbi:MAG: nitric oxide reductase [Chromatiales bacterium]|nr:nitric oxide reductase [Chromatiales bacterium]